MKYIASFPRTYQSGPEDYVTELQTMICSPDTTLGEIHEWMKKRTRYPKAELTVSITQDSALEGGE